MIRYAITDRNLAGGTAALLEQIRQNLAGGIDYIQIREKDLPERELLALTEQILRLARHATAKILVNGRVDIALAAGAHGVHLPANSIAPNHWRRIVPAGFVIGVSCHAGDNLAIRDADYILYAPVFAPRSKPRSTPIVGLEGLRQACRSTALPIIALGGITWDNAPACVEAGARGVAGISLFQAPRTSSCTM